MEAIVRFDEAHGYFHRDAMFPSEEQQKTPISAQDKGLALSKAIGEIKQFWRIYRKTYEVEYYDGK